MWFCDQPWMNRIGGLSARPHSRTCSRTPPPPVTVWTCIRPAIVVVISGLLVLVVTTHDRRWRYRRGASGVAPYLPRPGALSAALGMLTSAFRAGGPRRRARDARARARRRAGGPRRRHPRDRRRRYRQDPARRRAHPPRPR